MGQGREDKDWYAILEVEPGVDAVALERAWRRACFRWHPDRHLEEQEEAHRRFLDVGDAYAVLGDAGSRAAYDRRRGVERPVFPQASGPGRGAPDLREAVREAAEAESRRQAERARERGRERLDDLVRRAAVRDGSRSSRARLYLGLVGFLAWTTAAAALYMAVAAAYPESPWTSLAFALALPGCFMMGRLLVDSLRVRYHMRLDATRDEDLRAPI
jgi:curved DNA-binding protein CbpA